MGSTLDRRLVSVKQNLDKIPRRKTVKFSFRSDRRFVVKRYVERVFSNSSRWQNLSSKSFSQIEPIRRAFPLKDDEMKLMHRIFSWHFNGTLKFPIIAGRKTKIRFALEIFFVDFLVDQMIDWEELLDFIDRAELFLTKHRDEETSNTNSPSLVPTIPIGQISSKSKRDVTPMKKKISDENFFSTNENHWIQINNICVPYLIKFDHRRFLPFQILVDCDLFTDEENEIVRQLTIAATTNDVQRFQRIISSTSSIEFKLDENLLLIDLFQLIFAMKKILYIKFVEKQKNVNKTFKRFVSERNRIDSKSSQISSSIRVDGEKQI